MAFERASSDHCQLEFLISRYFDVQQLSAQVRQKWQQAAICTTACASSTLEEILRRQQAAEEKRQKQQRGWRLRPKAAKRSLQTEDEVRRKRAEKLEEKLAVAELKRQSGLEERKMKATLMLQKTFEAAERVSDRQSGRAARLGAKLEQADKVREQQIAAAAAKGSGTAAHAKAVSAATRAREEAEALKRRADLELRLQKAGDARHELTQTVLASLAPRGAEPFLVRRALTRSILRRQSSSRVLQRSWRSFAETQRTTAVLANAVMATGIISFNAIGRGEPPNPPWSPAACRRTAGTVASPQAPATPSNTPVETPPDASPRGSPRRQRPRASPVALIGVTTTLLNAPSEQHAADPFEVFAKALQSPGTLRATAALLKRLALKLPQGFRAAGIEVLLKKLFPRAQNPDRYPVRVFLCAFMILKHPQVVFNQRGEREQALGSAATDMVAVFEKLLKRLIEPAGLKLRANSGLLWQSSISSLGVPSTELVSDRVAAPSTADLLASFDGSWLQYLEQFVAWKLADAASLEAELVRVAVEMEISKRAKLSASGSASPRQQSPADREALVEQVQRDHSLLRERILRLGGQAGLARLEAGLAAARAQTPAAGSSSPPSPVRSAHTSPSHAPVTPKRPTSAAQATSPPTPGPAITNQSLAWELLYDLNFQLPTEDAEASWKDATGQTDVMNESPPPQGLPPAEAAAATVKRVRRIADRAFWDSIADAGAEQISGLLNELAMQLVDALPPKSRVASQARQNFSKERLYDAVAAGSADQLLPAFGQLAKMLHEVGAPARQQPAAVMHARIQAELQECTGNATAAARVLVKALRLMAAQLRLLQIDMSNATLRMLASSLAGGEGIRYAQQKFAAKHELQPNMQPNELATLLPHTRAWLAQASGQLPSFQPISLQVASEQVGAPATMRTGRVLQESAGSTSSQTETSSPAATPVRDIHGAQAWRGSVRIGLVSLVAAEEPITGQPSRLPETLELDGGRLHEAKEAFQQLTVLSACLLIAQQTAADRHEQLLDASVLKMRLKALLGDQNVGLPDLAAEICAALPSATAAVEVVAQALKRMLSRGSPGFKALTIGLTKVLQQMLLCNVVPDGNLQQALAKYGASELVLEARKLAEKLSAIAAVSEAVHEALYVKLADGLI